MLHCLTRFIRAHDVPPLLGSSIPFLEEQEGSLPPFQIAQVLLNAAERAEMCPDGCRCAQPGQTGLAPGETPGGSESGMGTSVELWVCLTPRFI